MQAVFAIPSEPAIRGAFEFLARRQITSLENGTGDSYKRLGRASARLEEGMLHVNGHDTAALRTVMGLDAPLDRIQRHFARDPLLGPLQKHLGPVLVPGCWSPFELSVRAILGQQVSVAAARTIAGRLVDRWGAGKQFPSASTLADAPLEEAGIIRQRAGTIRGLAQAVCDGRLRFEDESTEQLTAIKGIGDWTAQYIAMRAFRHTDAFPAADLILRRAIGGTTAEVLRRAEAWRPFRAYSVILLWRSI